MGALITVASLGYSLPEWFKIFLTLFLFCFLFCVPFSFFRMLINLFRKDDSND